MPSYYDEKKKKYVVDGQQFEEKPTLMDRLKEGFQDQNTKAQLEALRKRRMSRNG
jgi:hypothetical protein